MSQQDEYIDPKEAMEIYKTSIIRDLVIYLLQTLTYKSSREDSEQLINAILETWDKSVQKTIKMKNSEVIDAIVSQEGYQGDSKDVLEIITSTSMMSMDRERRLLIEDISKAADAYILKQKS